MFESEQRGKLILNGKAMPDEALARLLGLDKQRLTSILTVLLDYGVASRDEQGALVNRRMVKDEELRQVRAACGSMGGNPALMGGGSAGGGGSSGLDKQNGSKSENEDNQKVKQTVTPSSSLSSSASIQRLIDACVREHLGRDPRLVEIAVLETVLRRQGSANEHRPIKSVRRAFRSDTDGIRICVSIPAGCVRHGPIEHAIPGLSLQKDIDAGHGPRGQRLLNT
jgi:hypothetical protein